MRPWRPDWMKCANCWWARTKDEIPVPREGGENAIAGPPFVMKEIEEGKRVHCYRPFTFSGHTPVCQDHPRVDDVCLNFRLRTDRMNGGWTCDMIEIPEVAPCSE